ncbi:MAG: bifunctional diaminohydroxyphosphoribosylaminopyrimidine deaminase/5-amino-6-(5-phosphoribosylamino)uracil reductase RibD [Steroidobacter sp.]
MTSSDQVMMQRALELAARGLYTTHPNPRVGCVIAHGEEIIGEGWHEKAGEPHAEVHALHHAGMRAQGATVYVTLEPCSHAGRTPPCADALIAANIKRLVFATTDPNPLVNGQGIAKLRSAGIIVDGPVYEQEARELNAGFIRRMQHGLPLVRIKSGMSVDGRTALRNGISRWITSEESRRDVQHWRARSSAIVTGIGTVLADDPQLNVREADIDMKGRQPLRVICDSRLRTPANARIVQSSPALIYTTQTPRACGDAEVMQVDADASGRINLMSMMRDLASRGCNEVLVEAGSTLTGELIKSGLADELLVYVAPVLLGPDAQALVQLPLITEMSQRVNMHLLDARQLGSDMRLRYRIERA